jgi:hypothetical protein
MRSCSAAVAPGEFWSAGLLARPADAITDGWEGGSGGSDKSIWPMLFMSLTLPMSFTDGWELVNEGYRDGGGDGVRGGAFDGARGLSSGPPAGIERE